MICWPVSLQKRSSTTVGMHGINIVLTVHAFCWFLPCHRSAHSDDNYAGPSLYRNDPPRPKRRRASASCSLYTAFCRRFLLCCRSARGGDAGASGDGQDLRRCADGRGVSTAGAVGGGRGGAQLSPWTQDHAAADGGGSPCLQG